MVETSSTAVAGVRRCVDIIAVAYLDGESIYSKNTGLRGRPSTGPRQPPAPYSASPASSPLPGPHDVPTDLINRIKKKF